MTKSIKPILALISLVFWESSQKGGFIGRGFDQLFSIGLLMIIAFLLYKEFQKSQNYNNSRDERLEKLLANNTVAMNNSTSAIKEFTNIQKQTVDHLKDIDYQLDRIENKVDKG